VRIGNVDIGDENCPFVIAEMSGNHNQSLERALSIVEATATAGAHAIKLQTYTADTITLDVKDGDFFINDENSLWKGQSLHDLYKKHTLRGSGINLLSNEQMSWVWFVLVHHLMKLQSIFLKI
jgi:sialic acid synthase SpsE